MIERTDELLENRSIEFDLRAADFEVGALVQFLGSLAQDPVQALRKTREGHRANREQLLLNVA